MRLLKLNEKVQQMLIDEMLTTGHARALLAIDDQEKQYEVAQKIFDEKLSVRDTEKLVKMMEEDSTKKEEEKVIHDVDHTRELELLVQKQLGRTIKINEKGKKRSITIGYSDNEDLDKLLTILCGESFLDSI
jgi:ParB family chromosome partitioning protein